MEVGLVYLMSSIAITAEIISIIAMITFIYSTTLKNRKKFVIVQILFLVIDGVVWLLKSGFSALIQDLVGIARNICIYFNKQTKILDFIFISLAVILGLIVIDWKNFKFYELFPILANLEFTIVLLKSKKVKHIKMALIVSSSLWATYALFTGVYVTFAFNVLSFLTAVISLITILRKEKDVKV
jgi:hypothetical protein